MTPEAIHARHDARIAIVTAQSAANGHPITCRGSGCFGCCKEPVLASRSEVEWIVAGLSPEERERVAIRLRAWLTQVRASGLLREVEPHVFMWRMLNVWCPLLEDGRCLSYARRPFGCRSHLAIGDPANCHDDTLRGAQTFAICDQLSASGVADEISTTGQTDNDNLGVWLADLLLGKTIPSAARYTVRAHLEDDDTTLVFVSCTRGKKKRSDCRV